MLLCEPCFTCRSTARATASSLCSTPLLYGVPLSLTALVLIGHALRERMPSFALYAGAFFNVDSDRGVPARRRVSAGLDGSHRYGSSRTTECDHAPVYLLPWLSTRLRWHSAVGPTQSAVADSLLKLQLWLAISLAAGLFLPGLGLIVLFPGEARHWHCRGGKLSRLVESLCNHGSDGVARGSLAQSGRFRPGCWRLYCLRLAAWSLSTSRRSVVGQPCTY